MENVSLKNLFEQSKDALRSQLHGKKLPRDYQKVQAIVKETFIDLLAKDNEFRLKLIASDVKLLNSIIRLYSYFSEASISESIDFEKLSKQTRQKVVVEKEKQIKDTAEDALYLIPILISAFIRPWLTIPVAVASLGYRHYSRKSSSDNVRIVDEAIDESRPITEERINDIIEALAKICAEIDSIINGVRSNREDIKRHYEKLLKECTLEKMYPQILGTLRYVWKEFKETKSEGGQSVLMLISDFEDCGYKIVELSDNTRSFFDFKVNPNVSEEVMYLPAIIKNDEDKSVVIEKGIVYIPSQQK